MLRKIWGVIAKILLIAFTIGIILVIISECTTSGESLKKMIYSIIQVVVIISLFCFIRKLMK